MRQPALTAPFGDRLRYLIGDETVASFSERLGATTQSVYAYMRGDRQPQYDTLQQIALIVSGRHGNKVPANLPAFLLGRAE